MLSAKHMSQRVDAALSDVNSEIRSLESRLAPLKKRKTILERYDPERPIESADLAVLEALAARMSAASKAAYRTGYYVCTALPFEKKDFSVQFYDQLTPTSVEQQVLDKYGFEWLIEASDQDGMSGHY